MIKYRSKNGITLVALVVTIIVLLILATVSVQVLTGDNGLLTKTETAVQSNNDSQEEEKVKLAVTAAKLAGNGSIITGNLNDELSRNFENTSITLNEIANGWKLRIKNIYKIYRDGKVKILKNTDNILSINTITDKVEEKSYNVISLNSTSDKSYDMTLQEWTYDKNTGISLNTNKKDDSYYYIPFTVEKTGEYLCRMVLNKNRQDNAVANPLKYGISTSPVKVYSEDTFDILNFDKNEDKYVKLYEGIQYYIGAINRLYWNSNGFSIVNFSEIILEATESEAKIANEEDSESYDIRLKHWTFDKNIGFSLNTNKKDDSYYYIPFTVEETGEYLCRMVLNKNIQDNAVANPLKYGISTSPVKVYSEDNFNILNFDKNEDKYVKLYEGIQYYIGAINRLYWNSNGFSIINFPEILLKRSQQ